MSKLPRAARTFGQNLRDARINAKITQTELARRCGFLRQTPISLWEIHPDHLPEPRTIVKLAKALDIDPSILLRDVVTPYDELRASGSTKKVFVSFALPTLSAPLGRWLAIGVALDRHQLLLSRTLELEAVLRFLGEPLPKSAGPGDARYRATPAESSAEAPTTASAATARSRRGRRPRARRA